MKKFLKKNMSLRDISRREKKYIYSIIIIAIIVFNVSFFPLSALAQAPDNSPGAQNSRTPEATGSGLVSWISGGPIVFISGIITDLFGAFFGLIIYLEGQIIDYIISPNNFPLITAPIVTIGWRITRDLANMFFILILLIVSFTTVLKIKSYAIQQLWWKIVVAALLINFSLVIAGFLIDFTNILTNFFLKQIVGGGVGTITSKLAAAMQVTNFYNPAAPTTMLGGLGQLGAGSFLAVVGILLTLIGLIVMAFVFGAATIFLIVRILHLWFLLIFAPIVWMLWILPATSSYFSQWWNSFIKWTFFAPIYVFMIYLSLSIFDATGKFKNGVLRATPSSWGTAAPGLTTGGMPAAIFQFILVIAMMFGSLIVAQKFGVAGASASQKMLTGWGNSAKNFAGRQLRSRALGIGAKGATPTTEARPGLLVRGVQKLAAVPGGRLLANQVFKMTAAEAGTVETAQKQFANWTPDAIQAYLAKSPGRITSPFTQNQQMGAALALKEKGRLDKLSEDRIKELISLTSRYSPKDVDTLLQVAPHLATEFKKKTEDIVAKIEKADKITLQSLSTSDVVLNLNPNQLRDIAQKADDIKVQKVKDVIEAEFSSLNAATQAEISRIIAIPNKDRRNRELNAFTVAELNNRLGQGMPMDDARSEVKKLEKITRGKATMESPAWQI